MTRNPHFLTPTQVPVLQGLRLLFHLPTDLLVERSYRCVAELPFKPPHREVGLREVLIVVHEGGVHRGTTDGAYNGERLCADLLRDNDPEIR